MEAAVRVEGSMACVDGGVERSIQSDPGVSSSSSAAGFGLTTKEVDESGMPSFCLLILVCLDGSGRRLGGSGVVSWPRSE